MTFKVVIPARYGSIRLPGKALLDLGGKPMVQRVVEVAALSSAEEILVATDDERIAAVVSDPRRASARIAVMTRATHASGTDRIAEVAVIREWLGDTVIVNLQGDEPQMPPELIDQVAQLLIDHRDADIATLSTPLQSVDEFLNPNIVKVVKRHDGLALYFSRAPIPWDRDGAINGAASQSRFSGAARHLGIYAYRTAALLRMTGIPQSRLEQLEKLEQLRALEAGMKIVVGNAVASAGIGVDSSEDLERARRTY
jgi:3-deoxy-manno-octulosonate cytidylyltransferase (CMP-KDO synthetase)